MTENDFIPNTSNREQRAIDIPRLSPTRPPIRPCRLNETRHTFRPPVSFARRSGLSQNSPRNHRDYAMRLINVNDFELEEFHGDKIPPYAILSHRWEEEEVSLRDWKKIDRERKLGFRKIELACYQAIVDGHDWLWVDTCCIDKTSSAELSEAINSMFAWYANSERCYAFLSDVPTALDKLNILRQFRESRWFTRGWTLQELLAPTDVIFYAYDWSKIGSRGRSMTKVITRATGIDGEYLEGVTSIDRASVAKKMSWISRRETTRSEDLAYCMLGIFDINMPLLYGEGKKAFTRLQEEIIKLSNDQTIFCWNWNETVPKDWTSILAPSPNVFRHCGDFIQKRFSRHSRDVPTYQMTNAGLSMRLPTLYTMSGYIIAMYATLNEKGSDSSSLKNCRAWIPVTGEDRNGTLHVARVPYPKTPLILRWGTETQKTIIVKREQEGETFETTQLRVWHTPLIKSDNRSTFPRPTSPPPLDGRFGIYPTFVSSGLREAWVRGCTTDLRFNLGKNIMWLDSTHSATRRMRYLVVSTKIKGTTRTMGGEWKEAQATVCISARVKREGEFLVDSGWFCQILPTPDHERKKLVNEEMERHASIMRYDEGRESDVGMGLEVQLGYYVHGLGEGRIRCLELNRWSGVDDANAELSGSDIAVAESE